MSWGGNRRLLGDQEAVSRDAQGCVMMEAAPATPFVVTEPDLLLELLIVALDAPAQLGKINQLLEADVLRQCGEPVFGRLCFALWPFDQQPLRRQRLRDQFVVPDTETHTRKARGQLLGRPLPPCHRVPSLFR